MTQTVWLVKSPTNNQDPTLPAFCQAFLDEIVTHLGQPLRFEDNIQRFGDQAVRLYFVGSGGSEQVFKDAFQRVDGPHYLITTRTHNSLAAAMEILSYVNQQGESGEILHGDAEEIASRIGRLIRVAETKKKLRGMRLGVVGDSYLIGSDVNPHELRRRSGMELISIPFSEFMAECAHDSYVDNEWTLALKSMKYDRAELEHALGVYGACKRIVDRYQLDAFTLVCFDLLQPLCITGCLALAILNAEGIWAACEGDALSLVSMVVLGELTQQPVFMANPSRLYTDRNEVVLAHCILPLDMSDDYALTTHFESGLGIAISANFEPGACTLFKCKADFSSYYAANATIIRSMSDDSLCRTQLVLDVPSGLDYFLQKPISNHQMIVLDHHEALIGEFFRQYK